MPLYIVTAPLVIAKLPDGSDAYLYKGSQFSQGLSKREINRLETEGFIEELPAPPTASEVAEQAAAAQAAQEQAEKDRFDAAVTAAVDARLAEKSESTDAADTTPPATFSTADEKPAATAAAKRSTK